MKEALLYEAYACFLTSKGNLVEADKILRLGISRCIFFYCLIRHFFYIWAGHIETLLLCIFKELVSYVPLHNIKNYHECYCNMEIFSSNSFMGTNMFSHLCKGDTQGGNFFWWIFFVACRGMLIFLNFL